MVSTVPIDTTIFFGGATIRVGGRSVGGARGYGLWWVRRGWRGWAENPWSGSGRRGGSVVGRTAGGMMASVLKQLEYL